MQLKRKIKYLHLQFFGRRNSTTTSRYFRSFSSSMPQKTILGRNWLKTAGFRVRATKGSYLIFKAVGGGSDVSRLLNGFRKWRLFNNITSSVPPHSKSYLFPEIGDEKLKVCILYKAWLWLVSIIAHSWYKNFQRD